MHPGWDFSKTKPDSCKEVPVSRLQAQGACCSSAAQEGVSCAPAFCTGHTMYRRHRHQCHLPGTQGGLWAALFLFLGMQRTHKTTCYDQLCHLQLVLKNTKQNPKPTKPKRSSSHIPTHPKKLVSRVLANDFYLRVVVNEQTHRVFTCWTRQAGCICVALPGSDSPSQPSPMVPPALSHFISAALPSAWFVARPRLQGKTLLLSTLVLGKGANKVLCLLLLSIQNEASIL